MNTLSLIVIDPQRGFCHRSGSLAKYYGVDELLRIEKVIPKICDTLVAAKRKHLVMSEYNPAQFTHGDTSHRLARLCVPSINDDCRCIDAFSSIDFDSSTIKRQQDAFSTPGFTRIIDQDLQHGISTFVVSGFLLDHCVRETALSLRKHLRDKTGRVFVCPELTASRMQKYADGRVDQVLDELRQAGINIDSWTSSEVS